MWRDTSTTVRIRRWPARSGAETSSNAQSVAAEAEEELQIRAAVGAQQSFADWTDRRVDGLLKACAEVMAEHAGDLARQTVQETGMGREADKTAKIIFAARGVYASIQGQTGRGVLRRDSRSGLTEIAVPVGVVLGLMPLTNPVATVVSSALIALKAGNALVIRAHPRAGQVTSLTVRLLRTALAARGAPADLVQALTPTDRSQVRRLLHHPEIDLVLATGSSGLVAAAVSSGKPTLGAGGGNAPAWICDDADVAAAARAIVASKSFDHGIICGSEQHLLASAAIMPHVLRALERAGAVVLSRADVTSLERTLFLDGRVRRELVGRSPRVLAERAGLSRGHDARLLVAPVSDPPDGPWRNERLAPVLALREVADEADAIARCRQILGREGAGHTAAIHTRTRTRALAFARAVPASRIIVNGPASQGCIGLGNALTPSFTLACGPAGGSTTTDNVSFRHLTQVIRVAQPRPRGAPPQRVRSAATTG